MNITDEEVTANETGSTVIVENKLLDMPNEEYHSRRDYMSSSMIKQLIKNPYLHFHPQEQEQSDAFDIGNAIHCLILEPHKFDTDFAVAPQCDRRTKAGKETWAEFVESSEGKIVLKEEDYLNCKAIAESTLAIPEVQALLNGGVSEKSYFTEIESKDDGGEPKKHKVKIRMDRFDQERNLIVDVKSCINSSPSSFKRDIAKYGYHIQNSFYKDVIGAKNFVFLAIEKKPPYMVGIYMISEADEELGRELYKKALNISLESPEKYKYPLHKAKCGSVVQTLVLPSYVHYENEDI